MAEGAAGDSPVARCAALAIEGSQHETLAMDLDRQGKITEACQNYENAIAKLREAEEALPPSHPDRAVLTRHRQEVRTRIGYLVTCKETGAPIQTPLEEKFFQT